MPYFWSLNVAEEEFFGCVDDGSLEALVEALKEKGIVVDVEKDVEYES